jgi:hypothetical protein
MSVSPSQAGFWRGEKRSARRLSRKSFINRGWKPLLDRHAIGYELIDERLPFVPRQTAFQNELRLLAAAPETRPKLLFHFDTFFGRLNFLKLVNSVAENPWFNYHLRSTRECWVKQCCKQAAEPAKSEI